MLADLASDPGPKPSFIPHLQLRNEAVLIDRGADYGSDFHEVMAPVLRLTFIYEGVRVRAADSRLEVNGLRRDLAGERHARTLLESFGPIEVDDFGECAQIPGCEADYVVDLESDPDSVCHFGAVAVPRLRAAGWDIDVADDYEFRLAQNVKWSASLEADEDAPGWFDLQLGVVVDGEVVDLLPALLDILDSRTSSLLGLTVRHRSTAVPLGNGRYLAIEPQRLQGILTVLNELYENSSGGTDGLRFHEMSPLHLEGLDEAIGENNIMWSRDVDCRDRARELARGCLDEPTGVPESLLATLRPYQETGVEWMQTLRSHGAGGIMADDMGLGKTLQTIAHICAEQEAHRLDRPSLIVAPTSLIANWQREFAKFAPHLRVMAYHGPKRHDKRDKLGRANVVLTSYPIVIRDLEVFMEHEWHILALDEAQAIKNPRSQAHGACSAIDARARLCLSGTPVENNLGELRALFDFLMPGFFGDAESFRRHYRIPIEKLGDEERLAALRRKISPFVMRRLKSQVAGELPPKTHIVHSVDLAGPQRDLYEGIRMAAHATVRKVVDKKGFAASTIDILSALLKLRQVCCDPRLLGMESAQGIEHSGKTEALFELLDEMLPQGRKVLIFSQFARMLGLIGDELDARGISHATLTGSCKDRQAEVDRFQNGGVDVFLISLKAGGTGLNLTRADTVIHFDPWWNPAAQAQATDRAYRIGQKNPVFVYQLVVRGSVEERMLGLQAKKQALADGLLDAGNAGAALSADDIDNLLAPLTDDE